MTDQDDTEALLTGAAPVLRNPASGTELPGGVRVFHDGAGQGLIVEELAQRQLRLRAGLFAGSYLSLAVPIDDLEGLVRYCHLQFDLEAEASRPITCFLRLNLSGQSESRVLHDAIVIARGVRRVCFDLSAFDLEAYHLDDAWLDIIFSRPADVDIQIRQMEVSCADSAQMATGQAVPA